MKRVILLLGLVGCALGLMAQTEEVDSIPQDSATNKYTFSDFFDALEIPTTFGVSITPNEIEGPGFNTCFRLGWRQHRHYGVFVFISFDTHNCRYDSLYLGQSGNICSGTVNYYEVGMAVGYRVPLVKDVRSFYEQPYNAPVNFYGAIQPAATLVEVPTVSAYTDAAHAGETLYQTVNHTTAVPSLRFYAGVEWFVLSRLSLFAEVSYIQHLKPTIIEQAAIERGDIHRPSGPLDIGIGLSMFL